MVTNFTAEVRQLVSVILILLLGLKSFYSLTIYSFFYANRGYIAAVLCENRNKPQMHCNGHCFLKKQLKKAGEQERREQSSVNGPETTVYLVASPISLGRQSIPVVAGEYPPQQADDYSFQFISLPFHPPGS